MIKLRDHYFVAWLKVVKGYTIHYKDSGIYVNINRSDYNDVLNEYKNTLKPVFQEIRKSVKELSAFSSNSTNRENS